MKFVLFVEGHTEQKAVPSFLKRWLDPRLEQAVGIKSVRFEGWPELVEEVDRKARLYLEGPARDDVIAVVSLLDLYGPTIYPAHLQSAAQRDRWGKEHLEQRVNHERFRHFFAVHETEAWLLSQPEIFPAEVRKVLPKKVETPEQINFNQPPAHLLNNLYKQVTHKTYKKVVYGGQLFSKLDPDVAYGRCPRLKALLDEMLALAKAAGLGKAE
jgi:hypothetical protein